MRLWSLNPTYLDSQGLVALWREGLLAKKVLEGKTKGYKSHPQLERFKKCEQPLVYLNSYLFSIYLEAQTRNYNFQLNKLSKPKILNKKIKVTDEQLDYEFKHLLNKLKFRDKKKFNNLKNLQNIEASMIFEVVKGPIETWEKIDNNES